MTMMGIDLDSVGNHSFDRGEAYFRNELIPLAGFPLISANVVLPDGTTPTGWTPSKVFNFGHGVKVGFVGFTTESTPGIVFPGNLGSLEVTAGRSRSQCGGGEARQEGRRDRGTRPRGRNRRDDQRPDGALIDIADGVENVDVVIGDHNDLQVDAVRSNGVLVTENRGKGIRFTRIRIVIGPGKEGVVYKTADFHKPWTIGVTPDAAIQAKIDDLNAQLAPILGTQIGAATKVIPRADQCGGGTGRTCESLDGDVVTDAMRAAYAGIGVAVRDHQLRRAPSRPDVSDPGPAQATSARPFVAAAVPDHARSVARRASVREHRRHDGRERG